MVKCVFCGREEKEYIGLHLMKNDGTIAYYCSHKCRMNALKLGRDKRKVRWTEAFHVTRKDVEQKKKEMSEKIAQKSEESKSEVKAKAKAKKK